MAFGRVDLISHNTNFIYRARTTDGTLYALRLVAPGWRTQSNLRAESLWLDALSRDTDVPLPTFVKTVDDEPFVTLVPEDGGADRRAVLMRWLPGMLLGRRLVPRNIRKMGELFARLHVHAGEWIAPADFPDDRLVEFLGRNEENVLFTPRTMARLRSEHRFVLEQTLDRVRQAYESVASDGLRIIHCDLWHDNIKIYKGQLAPFDFEDTILGYRLHDIAMAMLDLAEATGAAEYERLLESFRYGYESRLPFPSGDLLGLQMGRILWLINWLVRYADRHFEKGTAFRVEMLRRALSAGQLVDPLAP